LFDLNKSKKKRLRFTLTPSFLLTKRCTIENQKLRMKNDELFYYLALQSIDGIGPIKATKLLKHFGGAKQLFQAKPNDMNQIKGIGSNFLEQINNKSVLGKAEKEIRFIETNKISAITYFHKDYPEKLRHCPDAPIILFTKGNFDINKKRIISIVGTRMMTPYGRQFLKEFIKEIKKFDPIIVSGLAYGVDICAHKESIQNGITTIGILAHGLDRIYPKPHAKVAEKMLENGGLFTEFWSGGSPVKENFIKRNRIIAGIAEATLVVESASKGGSLVTSDFASSYFRDVFAVPGRTTDKFSQGCNMLIKSNKAAMITSVNDLEYILGWTPKEQKKEQIQKKLFVEMSEDERKIHDFLLRSEKMLLDQLALETGLRIQKVLMILLQLELKGLVISHPGKVYEAV